jgi:hypothetical protein
LEILADGALLRLENPYGVPKLHLRLGKDVVEDIEFHNVGSPLQISSRAYDTWQDDPYQTQINALVVATEEPSGQSDILSTYEDALRTYELVGVTPTVSKDISSHATYRLGP